MAFRELRAEVHMVGGFVQSSILGGAAALIRARGGRPAGIARRSGIPLQALSEPDLPVSVQSTNRFFELAAQECRDRTWALSLAAGARLATIIGPLWILLRNARTVGQMCALFAQNFDLFSDAALVTIERQRDGLLLSWSLASGQAESEVQAAEFSLALIAKEIRSHLGRDWMPAAVLFRHARPPGNLSIHRAAFGPVLRFNQDRNGLLLDGRTIDTPLQGRDPAGRALASRVVELEGRTAGKSLGLQVEAMIRSLMPYAPCSLQDVASALGIGPRSLQKHLRQQSLSFVRIRDAVRADLAAKYLLHSDLAVSRIAEILGYGDTTSLSRSFRRWQGRTIRETRRRG